MKWPEPRALLRSKGCGPRHFDMSGPRKALERRHVKTSTPANDRYPDSALLIGPNGLELPAMLWRMLEALPDDLQETGEHLLDLISRAPRDERAEQKLRQMQARHLAQKPRSQDAARVDLIETLKVARECEPWVLRSMLRRCDPAFRGVSREALQVAIDAAKDRSLHRWAAGLCVKLGAFGDTNLDRSFAAFGRAASEASRPPRTRAK